MAYSFHSRAEEILLHELVAGTSNLVFHNPLSVTSYQSNTVFFPGSNIALNDPPFHFRVYKSERAPFDNLGLIIFSVSRLCEKDKIVSLKLPG